VLRRDTVTIRRAVDPDGRFRFDDLPPGRWVLRADGATLPAHQRLRGDSAVVDLAAGRSAAVDAALVETARPIQVVAEAEVVLGAPATPARPTAPPPTAASRAPTERIATAKPARRRAAPVAEAPRVAAAPLEYDDVIGSYTVVAGDRDLVAISYLVYATGNLWPRLWLANRDVLPDPDRLVPGVTLRIPAPGPLTAAERAELAAYRARR
jgi:nucleoid-associated protein YgaU